MVMLSFNAVTVNSAEKVPTPEEFQEQVRKYNESGGSLGNLRNRPVSPQIPKAAEQFNKAVTIHNNKKATPIELKEAASLYQAASDAGIPQASMNLAMLYLDGKGVKKDVKKAVLLLESASKKDVVEADMALASLYLNGKDVKRDEKKGEGYLNKAAKTKNPNAVKMLADYKDWKKKNELAMKQLQENIKKMQLSNVQNPQLMQKQPQSALKFPTTLQYPLNQSAKTQIPGLFMPTTEQILSSSMRPRTPITTSVTQTPPDISLDLKKPVNQADTNAPQVITPSDQEGAPKSNNGNSK